MSDYEIQKKEYYKDRCNKCGKLFPKEENNQSEGARALVIFLFPNVWCDKCYNDLFLKSKTTENEYL